MNSVIPDGPDAGLSRTGDVVAGMTGTSQGLSFTSDCLEDGQVRDAAEAQMRRYGWLDAAQRAGDPPNLLTLMGVRLYNPAIIGS